MRIPAALAIAETGSPISALAGAVTGRA